MKHKITIIVILSLTITPAFAQLSGGIVFDPTNYKNAVLRYLQLQQQLRQLQQAYSLTLQQYQFLQAQARQIQDMPARYRATFSDWHQLTSANTSGNTGQWVTGANTGNPGSISAGYSQIVPRLQSPSIPNLS